MTRTMFTLAVGVAMSVGGLTLAQTGHGHGKGPTVKTLSAVDVNEQLNGKPTLATTLEVTFEPGAASAPHRHPGPVFGYVLEGELMVLHAVSRNPSAKVRPRVLAVILHPRDAKALVVPEPAKGGK